MRSRWLSLPALLLVGTLTLPSNRAPTAARIAAGL